MPLLQKAYLGATPLFRELVWYEDYSLKDIVNAESATATADNTAHTKGAWSQIIASTSANASFLFCEVGGIGAGATNTATLLDIATGASGSESLVASNIAVGGAAFLSGSSGAICGFPLQVPSGTRISARIQSVVAGGKTGTVRIAVIDAGDYASAPTSVDVLGGNTANSEGVSFSGSSGTWVQGIASTSQDYRAVGLVVSAHNSVLSANQTANFTVGVGASGNEAEFGSARYSFDVSERAFSVFPYTYIFGRQIPTGSRISVKHNLTSQPDRHGFTLIGIP
jgi:hypothetical protein